MLVNTPKQFGLISILIHWSTAVAIIGLFALGVYMVGLDYYSTWYNRGPRIHESVGLLCCAVMLIRVLWRCFNPPPPPLKNLHRWEQMLAPLVHGLFYIVIFAVLISGYLISSAGGKAVAVFDWFTVPALVTGLEQQQDIAGFWHRYIAWGLIFLVGLHTLAALKHHFIDKDSTLIRIVSVKHKDIN